jgi:hypothetical protein
MERDKCLVFRVNSDGLVYNAGGAKGRRTLVPEHQINGVPAVKLLHRDCVGWYYKRLARAFATRQWTSVVYTLAPQIDPAQLSRRARILPVSQWDALVFEAHP